MSENRLGYEELRTLASEFGDAFYILDIDQFEKNVADLRCAFREYYENTELAYSYKTNYVPALCCAAHECGMYAEVVSSLEYEIAKKLGCQEGQIIYNGPVKPTASIRESLGAGAIVNLDSLEEFKFVESLATANQRQVFEIGLRCNVGMEPDAGSRFGISAANGDLDAVFQRLARLSNVCVTSLHTHYSHQRDAESYATRAKRLGEIYSTYCLPSQQHRVRIFDIGGGFFGPLPPEVVAQFSPPPPSYRDYARAVGPIVDDLFAGLRSKPTLVIEPGVGLVANVLKFICQVGSTKIAETRRIANTSGGVQNIKPSKSSFNLPLRIVSKTVSTRELLMATDICGFTCMEDDVLYHACEDVIENGDFLEFSNVGAYSVTFKPQFIRGAPAIIYRDNSGGDAGWKIARRRETVEDILSTYTIPNRSRVHSAIHSRRLS